MQLIVTYTRQVPVDGDTLKFWVITYHSLISDDLKTLFQLKSEKKNEITIPDHYTFYHYMYCKEYDTDVYILNLTESETDHPDEGQVRLSSFW